MFQNLRVHHRIHATLSFRRYVCCKPNVKRHRDDRRDGMDGWARSSWGLSSSERCALRTNTPPHERVLSAWCDACDHLVAVEEGEASDQVVHAIEAGLDKVLRVVAQELEDGKHSEAAVLQLLELALLEGLRIEVGLARVKVAEEAAVVNRANKSDDLDPAERRDRVDGGDTVRDVGEGKARSDLPGEAVDLRDDVADDGELGDAAVLELRLAVHVERLLVDVLGEAERIEEAGGLDDAELVLEADGAGQGHLHVGPSRNLLVADGRGERERGEDSGEHRGRVLGGAVG
mmetsp:Transcript_12103/g.41130  ORF Transcript_12103/g.41130 Transcript_12103/m.41130 type:complete len:289 (-) Transcript_12103:7-873(-)